jgi:TonB family protein
MMNRTAIYRPNSRWRIFVAFTVAAAIHLSAVAIASLRHEPIPVNPEPEFPEIDFTPDVDLPAPPQTEVPLDVPLPVPSPEFVELPQPARSTPRKQPVLPIRTVGQTSLGRTPNAKALASYAPRPEYPYEARSRRVMGSGVAAMTVDPATGFIEDVLMEQSIGSPILDNATISAFKRWHFKSGTARRVRVPITFTLTGAQY